MQKYFSLFVVAIFLLSCGKTTIVNELKVKHDFNGDGIADVLVGGRGEDTGGGFAGAAYIFYGTSDFATSVDASTADVKINGEDANDRLGSSGLASSDINDDGIDDVFVGAYFEDAGGGQAGAAYVFFGSPTLATFIDASAADIKIIGESASDSFGGNMSGVGDVNDDGIEDVVISASNEDAGGSAAGAAYVFFGSTNIPAVIDASEADVKIIGEGATDSLGYDVSGAGDVNRDGMNDFIVGAPFNDGGGNYSGAAYIIYGRREFPQLIDASVTDVKLVGEDANDYIGHAVHAAGDMNKDGFADVIVSAHRDDAGGAQSGSAYIFFGSETLPASIDASIANVKIIGEDANDYFGGSVSGGGDVNGDGFSDVIVAASQEDAGGSAAGAAYVFYGSNAMSTSIDASVADIKIIGEDASDGFGIFSGDGVAMEADFNADGLSDILVGAENEDAGGSRAGAAYIIYGSADLASSIDASAANVKFIGEDVDDFFGNAVSGGF